MQQAVDCLRRHQRPATSAPNPSVLQLKAHSQAKSQPVEAAMTTLLRGVFTWPAYSNSLPERAHEELDRFLDSLTD